MKALTRTALALSALVLAACQATTAERAAVGGALGAGAGALVVPEQPLTGALVGGAIGAGIGAASGSFDDNGYFYDNGAYYAPSGVYDPVYSRSRFRGRFFYDDALFFGPRFTSRTGQVFLLRDGHYYDARSNRRLRAAELRRVEVENRFLRRELRAERRAVRADRREIRAERRAIERDRRAIRQDRRDIRQDRRE
ncbi:MAG: hypothetical protein AAFT19_09105, partial [Pseudomonadota bacterium]